MSTQNDTGISLGDDFINGYKVKKCSELDYTEDTIFYFYDSIHSFEGKQAVLDSIESILLDKGIGFGGVYCTLISLDDWVEDFKEVVGYEKALSQPVMYFSVGGEIYPEEAIVTLLEARYYAKIALKIYLDLYPKDKNKLDKYFELL